MKCVLSDVEVEAVADIDAAVVLVGVDTCEGWRVERAKNDVEDDRMKEEDVFAVKERR